MTDSDLPVHWRFATGRAFAALRDLVRAFDFLHSANGATYSGITPTHLVEVVDGFLDEPPGVVFGGDQNHLRELRTTLVELIEPAHSRGLEAGRRHWHAGDKAYGSLSTGALHRLALEAAPPERVLRGWFAEGFCYAYAIEEAQSLKRTSD